MLCSVIQREPGLLLSAARVRIVSEALQKKHGLVVVKLSNVLRINRLPNVGEKHAIHALVKRPGRVIAAPVMIVAVGVGEKVPGKHRELVVALLGVHCVEIVAQSAELRLEKTSESHLELFPINNYFSEFNKNTSKKLFVSPFDKIGQINSCCNCKMSHSRARSV